jgi:hypothetical protein
LVSASPSIEGTPRSNDDPDRPPVAGRLSGRGTIADAANRD